ncbi:MFS transporter [Streptomyces sp. NPDC005811]|uniref:MFS transporter n=1 Tax=Streptomyces sp. NPDC005811 TaxID=3154565 RepID=UPI0033CABBFA
MSAPLAVVAVAFLSRASQLGLFSAEVLILLDRGVTEGTIGLVMAAAAAGGALAQLAAGRWGHRCRTTRMTLLGTGVQSAGCLAFATLTPWWSLAAADFLLMAGAALTTTGLRATLAARAPGGRAPGADRLERAYGRLTAAQMLGALVGPLGAGAVLLHGSAGAAWAATAVALTATAVAGTAGLRDEAVRPARARSRPEPAGLAQEAGQPARTSSQPSPAGLLDEPVRPDRSGAPPGSGHPVGPSLPCGPRPPLPVTLWPLLVLLFGITALYGGYSVVWAVYLRGLGARDAVIAWSAACLALPALALSPRAGAVLPRVSRPVLIRCAALVIGCCACLYPLVGSVAAAIALSVTEGILLAVALPLISAQVARNAGPGRTARAFGLLGTADALGSGLGTALGGALLAQGGAGEAFRFSGVLCLLCAAASLVPVLLRPPVSPTSASPPMSLSSETGRSPHVSRSSPRIRPVRR